MRKFWVLILFFLPIQVFAEDEEIAKIFAQYGVEGTIIISTLTSNQKFTHNDMRANKRFSPASTFKIPNTLISLESKAILGKDDLFKWDGTQYDFPDWNHDQTLASAFKVSCVWCYQALAKRVGTERYENYLNVLGYGELHKPFEVTMFWLNDSLKISAIEQLEFLKKLYQRTLPFSSNAYETLKEIMQVEKMPSFTLFAKTGWTARLNPQIGWYVGYVETPREVWLFALNLDIRNAKDLILREKITKDILKQKGIIE